jgi:hypothetical protein
MNELKSEHADIVDQFIKQTKSENYSFMLTVARDGESPARSIYNFSNAIDAAHAFSRYDDNGFAKEYLTVRLYEPNGNIQEKVLRRPPAGECSFVKKNYSEVAQLFLNIKENIPDLTYQKMVTEMALIFSKDNPRFDEKRFFNQTGVEEIVD